MVTGNYQLYKLCPVCKFFCSTNEPDLFCSLCGTKLILDCPSCQKEVVNPHAKHCKYCGAPYPGRIDVKQDVSF